LRFVGQPGQIVFKTLPFSKITRAKWTEGMAQAVEHETLSSNLRERKREREKERERDAFSYQDLLCTLWHLSPN
jgi:hypothetical protein